MDNLKLKDLLKIEITEEMINDSVNAYDENFWKRIEEMLRKENDDYEKRCKKHNLDPRTGYPRITYEDLHKEFNC